MWRMYGLKNCGTRYQSVSRNPIMMLNVCCRSYLSSLTVAVLPSVYSVTIMLTPVTGARCSTPKALKMRTLRTALPSMSAASCARLVQRVSAKLFHENPYSITPP